jgi:nitric oxide reductase NorE protein
MHSTDVRNSAATTRAPGSEGLWTFVFIDMVVFQMIFLTYMSERLGHVDVYRLSQSHLNEIAGLANTLILLTSSWMMVQAVHSARQDDGRRARRFLGLAWLLGLLFCLNKLVEYHTKLHAGFTPASNSFFSYYFFITAIHFAHVIAGMIFIVFCYMAARRRPMSMEFTIRLENVGLFWHFVDVLWIFIFPLLYLVGRN